MSLKAKIEAVIYAAEEPVTLVQLAALFGAEALQQKTDRAIAEGNSPSLDAAQGAFPHTSDSELDGEFEPLAKAGQLPESSTAEPASEPRAALGPDSTTSAAETISPDDSKSSAPNVLPDDEKRLARQRDREVREELRWVLAELMDEYLSSDRGMEIREIAGGYRVATKPEYHDAVRSFVKSLKPVMKLSLQALETLAVIAYKQPVTAPEVSEIRGVDSGGVLGSLMSRKLITTAGRKQVIGRPILYKTTREFLLRFGLKDVGELPSIEEFEKMAGELAETDAETESVASRNGAELPFAAAFGAEAGQEAPIENAEALPETTTDTAASNAELPPDSNSTNAIEENATEPGLAVSSASEELAEAAPLATETEDEAGPPIVALDVNIDADQGGKNNPSESDISITAADHSDQPDHSNQPDISDDLNQPNHSDDSDAADSSEVSVGRTNSEREV